MHYFSYNESKQHGTLNFPVAHYFVDSSHTPYTMPLHWHKEWELIYVTDGKMDFIINGEHIVADAGDVILMPDATLHSASAEACAFQCLNFGLHERVLNVLSVRDAFRFFYPKDCDAINSKLFMVDDISIDFSPISRLDFQHFD